MRKLRLHIPGLLTISLMQDHPIGDADPVEWVLWHVQLGRWRRGGWWRPLCDPPALVHRR